MTGSFFLKAIAKTTINKIAKPTTNQIFFPRFLFLGAIDGG